MHNTLRLLLPTMLLATTLAACGDKAPDASADASAPRSKSFNVTAKAKNGAADEEEISRFRLTMDGVRKLHAINSGMAKLDLEKSSQASTTSEDSAAADEKESDSDSDGGSNEPSIDELEAFINGNKQARDLIAAQGMDTRDYVVMTHALMVVGVAQMAIDQGARPDSVAKEMKVSAENLKFLKEHRKEIDQMQSGSKKKGE
jgi:predicted small lipoprotein YifL